MHHVRELDEHVARKIDTGRFERVLHFFLKLEECRSVRDQRLMDGRLGRQDRKALVGANHRTFDEQAVDAARVLDGIRQTATRLQIERESPRSEVDVEVQKGRRPIGFLAQQPSQRSRDRRRADATADAEDGGHDVRLVDLRFAARTGQDRLRIRERVAQMIDRERHEQIVVDAACDEVAIEADIVYLARCDHDRPRLADFRKRVDVVQRVSRFREVDEQDVRARGDRQGLDRVA